MQKLVGKKYFWLILFAICGFLPLLASEIELVRMRDPNIVVSIKLHISKVEHLETYFAKMEDGSRIRASRLRDGRIFCQRYESVSQNQNKLDRLPDEKFYELEKMYREMYWKKQK